MVFGERTSYWVIHLFPGSGGRGGGGVGRRLLVDLVSLLEQKTMRKGTFFFKLGSAQRCHRLGSEIWHFSGVGKGVGFLKPDKKKKKKKKKRKKKRCD